MPLIPSHRFRPMRLSFTILVLIVLMLSHRAPAQPAPPADIGNRTVHDHLQTIVRAGGRPAFDARGELVELDLASQRTSVSDLVVESVVAFPSIRKLRVAGNLGRLFVKLDRLKRLTLRDMIVFGRALEKLPAPERLEDLRLSETWVDDDMAPFLARCPKLRYLDLRATQIGDATAAQLHSLGELRYLQLEETRLTDEGVKSLADLKKLEFLSVAKTSVTTEGIQRLRAALPDCEITMQALY